jgi:hypothetical protein
VRTLEILENGRRLKRVRGFSKKLENLEACVAIFMANYNFVWRTRKPVGGRSRVPAAMAAGVVKELWKFEDLYEQAIAA